jgi:peroxiredoxin
MRLKVGDTAPSISVTGLRDEQIDTTHWNDKPVWVGFFRFASCPLCNLRVHQMIGSWPRYSPHCHYVAVFQSPAERFEGFLTKHSPPFPVVADPEMDLFRRFGVESSVMKAMSPDVLTRTAEAMKQGFALGPLSPKDGAAFRVPADFIIGTDGTLTMVHYGANVSESVPFAVVDKALGC